MAVFKRAVPALSVVVFFLASGALAAESNNCSEVALAVDGNDPCCTKGYECTKASDQDKLTSTDVEGALVQYEPKQFVWRKTDKKDGTKLQDSQDNTLFRQIELSDNRGRKGICYTQVGVFGDIKRFAVPKNSNDHHLAYVIVAQGKSRTLFKIERNDKPSPPVSVVKDSTGKEHLECDESSDVATRPYIPNISATTDKVLVLLDENSTQITNFVGFALADGGLVGFHGDDAREMLKKSVDQIMINTCLRVDDNPLILLIGESAQKYFTLDPRGYVADDDNEATYRMMNGVPYVNQGGAAVGTMTGGTLRDFPRKRGFRGCFN